MDYSDLGWIPVHKFGRNADVDTTTDPEDIWSAGGVYAFPSAAAVTTVKSDDINDDGNPASTGALTVTVEGLDSNYSPVSQTVTMNGTTAVALSTNLLRVNRAYVDTAGSSGTNEGTIQVLHTATVLAQIEPTYGQTLQAIYTVPAGYSKVLLLDTYFNIGNAAVVNVVGVFQMREEGKAWRIQEIFDTTKNGPYGHKHPAWLTIAEKADLRMRALTVDADNTSISAGFNLVLKP